MSKYNWLLRYWDCYLYFILYYIRMLFSLLGLNVKLPDKAHISNFIKILYVFECAIDAGFYWIAAAIYCLFIKYFYAHSFLMFLKKACKKKRSLEVEYLRIIRNYVSTKHNWDWHVRKLCSNIKLMYSWRHYFNDILYIVIPFFFGWSVLLCFFFIIVWLKKSFFFLPVCLLGMLLLCFIRWFSDMYIEYSLRGRKIRAALCSGFFLFLSSEVMLFGGFFWAYFDRFFNPSFLFFFLFFLLCICIYFFKKYAYSTSYDLASCSYFWRLVVFLYYVLTVLIYNKPSASNVLQKRMHLHAYQSLSWFLTVKLSNQTVFCITNIILYFFLSYVCNTLAVWGTPLLAEESDAHADTCLFCNSAIRHVSGETLKFFRETMWHSFGIMNVMKECTGSFIWDIVSFFFPCWHFDDNTENNWAAYTAATVVAKEKNNVNPTPLGLHFDFSNGTFYDNVQNKWSNINLYNFRSDLLIKWEGITDSSVESSVLSMNMSLEQYKCKLSYQFLGCNRRRFDINHYPIASDLAVSLKLSVGMYDCKELDSWYRRIAFSNLPLTTSYFKRLLTLKWLFWHNLLQHESATVYYCSASDLNVMFHNDLRMYEQHCSMDRAYLRGCYEYLSAITVTKHRMQFAYSNGL